MNFFTDCEKKITQTDISLVENDLSIKFPEAFKSHYLIFNGGTPKNTLWIDPEGKWDENEVGDFLPLRFRKSKSDDPDFTIDGIAREEWASRKLPPSLVPFAVDWGGNYFCINHITGEIFFYVKDIWDEKFSDEDNWKNNTRYITSSIQSFVDNLEFNFEN
ncbi:MAG: SMI1/KNR4 family protein [Pseudomonadota bacterium]